MSTLGVNTYLKEGAGWVTLLPEIQEAVELLQFQDDCRFTGNLNFISSDIHVLKMFHRRLKASDFLLITIAITLLLCFCAHPSLNSEFVNFAMWSDEKNKSSRIHLFENISPDIT